MLVEVVDFIVWVVDFVLCKYFGCGLIDEGVYILDGFVGMGIFIIWLLQFDLIMVVDFI